MMQSIKTCAQWFSFAGRSIDKQYGILQNVTKISATTYRSDIHTSAKRDAEAGSKNYKWLRYNKKIFPVQKPEEERRPAVSKTIRKSL